LKKIIFFLVLISLIMQPIYIKNVRAADDKFSIGVRAADDKFSIGLKAGINKLEGDWREPRFNPMGAFVLSYAPIPYFEIGAEVNYSLLRTNGGDGKDLEYVLKVATDNALALPLDHNKFESSSMPGKLEHAG